MDNYLYVAMSGASNVFQAQTVAMNNLANVNTIGFRADLQNFYSDPVSGGSLQTRAYSTPQTTNSDLSTGGILTTERDLDVAVKGPGWFVLQDAQGREGMTRAGDFEVTSTGQLVSGQSGLPVLGDGGPITIPPAQKIIIATDGTVSIKPVGSASNTLAVVGRLKLVNPLPQDITKQSNGLFYLKNGGATTADPTVHVASGMLESSNVNAVGEMMNVINLSREFELQVKMMKNAESADAEANQVMSVTGTS